MILDLVLLGLLMHGPRHGYEIKKFIDDELSNFTNISSGPIYYALSSLEKRGLVRKTIEKPGKRPERYVYHITNQGEKEFYKLIYRNFLILERPLFNLDISLYFLDLIEPQLAIKRLNNRLANLKITRDWAKDLEKGLMEKKSPYHLIILARHTLKLMETEIGFVEELIEVLMQQAEAISKTG
ncbi:MAG TPA: PadR family transcriptional regulator [Syntrophaceae bacterium]|nr:PadR family transcriptional regulator [Syntrophaceae bacterium]